MNKLFASLVLIGGFSVNSFAQKPGTPASQMEKLDRGVIATLSQPGKYFLSWRYLANDEKNTSFRVLRDGKVVADHLTQATSMEIDGKPDSKFQVVTLVNGVAKDISKAITPSALPYMTLRLNCPPNGESWRYTPNDCSVGDVDGDGQYELIVKWDPSNSHDNSHRGYTGNTYIDCYKFDGTQLWRVDLGKNIRSGAHYTQFMVYDFDGDGKAEMICKTAPGTLDGKGHYVNQAATDVKIKSENNQVDYRNNQGLIMSGPEYLTVFEGQTGKAVHTIYYNPNREGTFNQVGQYPDKSFWGDEYANRSERYLAAVAYLDGPNALPSAVMCRGYYTRSYLWAVDYQNGKLNTKWLHASVSNTEVDRYDAHWNKTVKTYQHNTFNDIHGAFTAYGQGAHSLSVADVDGDGCDEITYGSAAIDHDGYLLYSTGLGHGDAQHLSDFDPDRPGLEYFMVLENDPYGFNYRDARTGEVLLYHTAKDDTGRGLMADIDSTHRGAEYSYIGQPSTFDIKGCVISTVKWLSNDQNSDVRRPRGNGERNRGFNIWRSMMGMNFRIYWDGDAYDEMLNGNSITKWNGGKEVKELGVGDKALRELGNPQSCNGSKSTPCLQADLFGDWREEVILRDREDPSLLYIYSTQTPTPYRVPCLMQDHVYRMGVAWQNVSYNQPPHLGYYLPDYIETFQGK